MNDTHVRWHRLLQPCLIALVASACCVTGIAHADGHYRYRHDQLTIQGSPATQVTAGQAYAFTPSATDSLGRALVFAITNKPTWATFDASSGQLSGTPSTASVGTFANIVIAVSDGWKSATLPAFSVQVLGSQSSPPPPAPTPSISGTPPTSDVAGNAYAFQPVASGPSGMPLSFSVQNKPAWANFSIASGQLSGTPASNQTGTYGNIVISVSDGQASSALAPFNITVTSPPVTAGSASVTVTPPTQNTDGSPLTDLAGVTIYYGTSPASLSQSVQLSGTQPSYTIGNLASGTWYFAGVAYNSAGTQSAMSTLVSKTIP